jgi:hypothetical protein
VVSPEGAPGHFKTGFALCHVPVNPCAAPGPVKNFRKPLRAQDLNLDFQVFCPYFCLARAGFSHWFRDLGAQAGKVEQSHVYAKFGFRADFGGGGS